MFCGCVVVALGDVRGIHPQLFRYFFVKLADSWLWHETPHAPEAQRRRWQSTPDAAASVAEAGSTLTARFIDCAAFRSLSFDFPCRLQVGQLVGRPVGERTVSSHRCFG